MEEYRLDQLPPAAAAARDFFVAAMKDNMSVKLTVGQMLDLIIGAAPGQLDTLDELAAALADDANFASTITAALANKLDKDAGNVGDATAKAVFRTAIGAATQGSFSVVQRVFTSSGTYTPTTGMVYCIIECVGGGGGGGGTTASSAGSQASAGGGGGGEYARKRATATDIGASKTVTIGTGGSGGSAGNNAGTAGGDTSVGSLCVAKGGQPGAGNSANSGSDGGAGGTGGTGDLLIPGKRGGDGGGGTATTVDAFSGEGGDSRMGFGGRAIRGASSNGRNGTGYGAGGSGGMDRNAAAARAGGSGTAGDVLITEFIA